jgi:hypothetical protein
MMGDDDPRVSHGPISPRLAYILLSQPDVTAVIVPRVSAISNLSDGSGGDL